MEFLITGRGLHPFLGANMPVYSNKQSPGVPAFRQQGVGSLVTRRCTACGLHRTTRGSTGSGLTWRCQHCPPVAKK